MILVVGIPDTYRTAYATSITESDIVEHDSVHDNLGDAALNSRTNKLYFVDKDTNGVGRGMLFVLNATANLKTISSISENAYPSKLAINEETNTIYVLHSCNCQEGKSVSIANGRTDEIVGSIDNVTGAIPTSIHVNSLTNKIYVSDGHEISVIDGKTNKVLKTSSFGKDNSNYEVFLMTINPAKNIIYGFDSIKQIVSINLDSLALSYSNTTIGRTPNASAIDNRPLNMIVNPNTHILYVINEAVFPPPGPGEGAPIPIAYLVAVNATSGKVISDNVAELRGLRFHLQINSEKNIVYVSNGISLISVIDVHSNNLKEEYYYKTGSLPSFYPRIMLRNPATNSLYFVDPGAIIVVPEVNVIPEFPLPILSTIVAFTAIVGYFSIKSSKR